MSGSLALVERDDKLQSGMRRREGDNLHILQTRFSSGGDHVVLCNALLTFGINDPERGGALHGFRDLSNLRKFLERIGREENSIEISRNFVLRNSGVERF